MKWILFITILASSFSCNSKNATQTTCDSFVGKWVNGRSNFEITKEDGKYIFIYELVSGPIDNPLTESSPQQSCKCTNDGIITENKDLLTISAGSIRFRGEIFTNEKK